MYSLQSPDGGPEREPGYFIREERELSPQDLNFEKTIAYMLQQPDFMIQKPDFGTHIRNELQLEMGEWGEVINELIRKESILSVHRTDPSSKRKDTLKLDAGQIERNDLPYITPGLKELYYARLDEMRGNAVEMHSPEFEVVAINGLNMSLNPADDRQIA
jgi:hypothetical protein